MTKTDDKIFDCLILGGGPAGMSGALYCSRGGLDCAIVDSSALGGSPTNTCEIENYLGFNRIEGAQLCERFEEHIDNFNVKKFPFEEIQSVDLISPIKSVKTLDRELHAKTIIIATGAKPKKLGVRGEIENIGKGVSYCAVCDGAFYKDKITAVVGGGNAALEEALYLTRFAKIVYLIHRRQEFRADEIVQKRVRENKKIKLILDSTVEEILADKKVIGAKIKNVRTNQISELDFDGIFPYIGMTPNSELFSAQLKQDEKGFIITDTTMKTSLDGVYAIGDIRNTPLRQVITAVSDGAIAGVMVSQYLMMKNRENIRK